MSDIITEAGVFRFINRTRYNSEDIANLYTGRLAAAKAATGGGVQLTSGGGRENVNVYELADYKPAVVWETRNVWNGTRSESKRVAHMVKAPGWAVSNNWKLNILPPDRLYENPVEALTVMNEDEPLAPAELSVQLVNAFRYIGKLSCSNWRDQQEADKAVDAWAATQRIRIMPKRENSLKSATRQTRQNKSAAIASVNSFLGEIFGTLRSRDAVLAHFATMAHNAGQVGEPVCVSAEELRIAFETLERVRAEAGRVKDILTHVGVE